ncbi:MAG: vitamin K epoxide reductase family protein [Dehalococcoidia bacterium]|nr:vitamin K epoxide reductase family protein [Dehalococcoidia bacterium]MDW8119222.1 vitamin K epoxide reductase family protein [Chloroflexota bacterium]
MDWGRWLQACLAGQGIGVAGYLTIVHYLGTTPVCVASEGCAVVQNSPYATLWGVPVALLGLLVYVVLGVVPLVEGRMPAVQRVGTVGSFILALGGLGFSAYLTWLELFVIKAICTWCVYSAVLLALLTPITFWRAWKAWA